MKTLKKKLDKGCIARLKNDLLLLLGHIEKLELPKRQNFHQSSFEKDVAALHFLIGEAD